jgi:hypothetical protein
VGLDECAVSVGGRKHRLSSAQATAKRPRDAQNITTIAARPRCPAVNDLPDTMMKFAVQLRMTAGHVRSWAASPRAGRGRQLPTQSTPDTCASEPVACARRSSLATMATYRLCSQNVAAGAACPPPARSVM